MPRASSLARLGWLALVAALGLALAKSLLVDVEAHGRSLLLAVTVLSLVEGCCPWRERSPRAQARRALQAILLAANALSVGASSPDSTPERVSLLLASLVALPTTLSLLRATLNGERAPVGSAPVGGPLPDPPHSVGRETPFLWGGLALLALAVLWTALVPERRVPLEPHSWRAHDALAAFPRFTLARIPDEAVVSEDGRPLPYAYATQDAIAELGSGRYQITAGRYVHLSASDSSDPAANGRRYEIAFVPDVLHSAPVVLLGALALGLVFLSWSLGAIALERPSSSPRARAALVLAVALACLAPTARSWDELTVTLDSDGYLEHSTTRPFLYPAFLDLFDRAPGTPRTPEAIVRPRPEEPLSGPRSAPEHRFLNAVRAQRVLTVAALAVLAWELSATLSPFFVLALVFLAGISDLATWGDRALHYNAGTLLAEGLCQPLGFLFVAAFLNFARKRTWPPALALAGLLAALVLARPASSALLLVLPTVFALDARESGWRAAAKRAGVLVLLYAIPLVCASVSTYTHFGYFRYQALTGPNLFGTAFEVAEPADAASFLDPRERAFLERCFESPQKRLAPDDLNFPDTNIYAIGYPALEHLPNPPRNDFETDDFFLSVGKKLVLRHPVAYTKQALREVSWLLDESVLPLLVAGAIAFIVWLKKREPAFFASTFLAYAFLASLPFVATLPACLLHVPKSRYRSPWGFVETAGVPLLAFLIVSLRTKPAAPASDTSAPAA